MNDFTEMLFGLLESWPNRIVIFCLALLTSFFVAQFCKRAVVLWWKMGRAIKELKTIKAATNDTHIINLDPIANQAMITESLKHLWTEDTETLHPQKKIDEFGQEQIFCWRATTMAEAFFSEQVLVDTPLKTEFYKHLPGILTGLGIIGTFSGLIRGLTQFEVSNNPEALRGCLRNLIQGVGHAFYVSATAIGLAMFFTWIEKALITTCYRQVEEICQLIDSFFNAGVGEEYLARLVQASETSATQAMQLKDALVTDLRQILSANTVQQVQASEQNTQQMSQNLAQAFTDTLRIPMERISIAVDRASSNQGEAVNQMLTDVLANFSAQMQDMFGGQFRGMTDLLGQTNNAMLTTVAKFDQLAANLQNAGQGAADAMAEKLRESIVAMEARQGAMTQQMQNFVEQMRAASQNSQTESAQGMQRIITELGDKISLMVSGLDEQAKASTGVHNDSLLRVMESMESFLNKTKDAANEAHQHTAQASQQVVEELSRQVQETVANLQDMTKRSDDSSAARQTELSEQATKLLGALMAQVEALGNRVSDSAEIYKSSAVSVARASTTAIERMNFGADSMLLATSEFSDAEKRVAATMGSMGQSIQGLQISATTLSGASSGVQRVFDDYKISTGTFASIVTELKATVETARREASLTTELVSRLQGASEKLASASEEADRYLDGVTEILSKAHASFADNVTRTMREGNSQFHKELSEAVNYLKGAIMDLGDTLDSVRR